jgi:hypothetical protein
MSRFKLFMHNATTFDYFHLGFSPNRFSPEWLRKHEAKPETIRPLHLSLT